MKLSTLLALMLFSFLAFASPTIVDQSFEFDEIENVVYLTAELCDNQEMQAIPLISLASAKSYMLESTEAYKSMSTTNSRREIPPLEYEVDYTAFTDTSDKKKKVYKPTNRKWYDHYYRSSIKRN